LETLFPISSGVKQTPNKATQQAASGFHKVSVSTTAFETADIATADPVDA
jgi:hypothetical protein